MIQSKQSNYMFCGRKIKKQSGFNATDFYNEVIYGDYFSYKNYYSHLVMKDENIIAYCIIENYIFGANHVWFDMIKNVMVEFEEVKNVLKNNIDFQKYLGYDLL